MSKKDVDNYFTEITCNYREMVDALKDMQDEANKGLVNPDMLENLKKSIEPLKQNYMRISYIMYLLNRPVKKKKHNRYDGSNKKLLDNIDEKDTLNGIIDENKNIINNMNFEGRN